jgi:hypothetical protein
VLDEVAADCGQSGASEASVPAPQMDSACCVRNDKSPANVERALRSLETIDPKVRPTPHRRGGLARTI